MRGASEISCTYCHLTVFATGAHVCPVAQGLVRYREGKVVEFTTDAPNDPRRTLPVHDLNRMWAQLREMGVEP